jgi:hypothetical protein
MQGSLVQRRIVASHTAWDFDVTALRTSRFACKTFITFILGVKLPSKRGRLLGFFEEKKSFKNTLDFYLFPFCFSELILVLQLIQSRVRWYLMEMLAHRKVRTVTNWQKQLSVGICCSVLSVLCSDVIYIAQHRMTGPGKCEGQIVKALKSFILNPGSLWVKITRHSETWVKKDGSLAGVQTRYF